MALGGINTATDFKFAFNKTTMERIARGLKNAARGGMSYMYLLTRADTRLEKKANCLAVVAIAKNESEYIREWCAWHKAVGVDRIYLYDNDSDDNMLDEIDDFIRDGFVICNSIHGKRMQNAAYNDALKKYGDDCTLMAFIDCDEYMVPLTSEPISKTILDAFSVSKLCGGIGINWCMYGSSGYESKPDGLCVESFTYRAKCPGGKGIEHIKSVVAPKCVKSFIKNPHSPEYERGYCGFDFYGSPIGGPFNRIDNYKGIKLNHYFTKSLSQWKKRRGMPRADTGEYRTLSEFYEHDNNDVYDPVPVELIEKTKEFMQRCV